MGLVNIVNEGFINDEEAIEPGFILKIAKVNDLIFETDFTELTQRQEFNRELYGIVNDLTRRNLYDYYSNFYFFNSYNFLLNRYSPKTFYDAVRSMKETFSSFKSKRGQEVTKQLEEILILEKEEEKIVKQFSEELEKATAFIGSYTFKFEEFNLASKQHFSSLLSKDMFIFSKYPIKGGSDENISFNINRVKDLAIEAYDLLSKLYELQNETSYQANIGTVYITVHLEGDIKETRADLILEPDSQIKPRSVTIEDYFDIDEILPNIRFKRVYNYLSSIPFLSKFVDKHQLVKTNREFRRFKKQFFDTQSDNLFNEYCHEVAKASKFTSTSNLIYSDVGPVDFNEVYEKYDFSKFEEVRTKFKNIYNDFDKLVNLLKVFKKTEKEGYPVTFPKLVQDDVIDVKEAYPVRLAIQYVDGIQKKDLVIPNDIYLGEKPIVLTGNNAGGKSIYMTNIVDTVLLAQYGLPILASEATIGIRDAIFVHKIKDGDSRRKTSTFMNSVERFVDMFAHIGNYKRPLVAIDELAAGTDPQSAIDVSNKKIMPVIFGISGSRIVVTQYRPVSEIAEMNGAIMLKGSRDYVITPGIGDAEGLSLAEEVGLTDEFVNSLIGLK